MKIVLVSFFRMYTYQKHCPFRWERPCIRIFPNECDSA